MFPLCLSLAFPHLTFACPLHFHRVSNAVNHSIKDVNKLQRYTVFIQKTLEALVLHKRHCDMTSKKSEFLLLLANALIEIKEIKNKHTTSETMWHQN